MKFRLSAALLCILLFTGCGAHSEEPVPQSASEPGTALSTEDSAAPSSTEGNAGNLKLRHIRREDAGLDLIPYLSLEGMEIHPTILEAYQYHLQMEYPEFFPDTYYQQGLEAPINHYSDALIISNRWKDPIIGGISIGSTGKELIARLGEPAKIKKTDSAWRYYYKTGQYYLLFEGALSTDKIQCALLSPAFPMPEQYNDAIEQIVRILEENQDNENKAFEELGAYGFFDGVEMRHGGILGADSPYGVSVTSDDFTVIIHNNFEGELYQLEDEETYDRLKIKYRNYDPYMDYQSYTLDAYHDTHNPDYYEEVSHDGRYYIYHEFVYSQAQYIWVYDSTLRRNPYRVWAQRVDFDGGYGWLDDTYTIFCYDGMYDGMLLIDISDELPRYDTADEKQKRDILERYHPAEMP